MNKKHLYPADILLPKENFESWAVIACDQFTSDRGYWDSVENTVGDKPSALRITLPEIYLSDDREKRIADIDRTMKEYLESGIFDEYPCSMIYLERRQHDGRVRRGLIGAIDLEDYDYRKGAKTLIRATEETVPDRLPPRINIRKDACLELPHILMLIDDPTDSVIKPVSDYKESMKKLYDFTLMMNGGSVKGYLLDPEKMNSVENALSALAAGDDPLLFAVGDGNHSLAAAKECRLRDPNPRNRFALVEVVNIHDSALDFEPIYRVLFRISPERTMTALKEYFGDLSVEGGQKMTLLFNGGKKEISVSPRSGLTVGSLQLFINDLIKNDPSVGVDYIHEIETVEKLSGEPDTVGFLFEGMRKDELFKAVISDGALPRKTFSMGEGVDKRYYIEARRIK